MDNEKGTSYSTCSKMPAKKYIVSLIDGEAEAHLIAMACSQAPTGYTRWTLRLLAEKMVALEYVDSLSHESVRQVLKKTKLNPGSKNVG